MRLRLVEPSAQLKSVTWVPPMSAAEAINAPDLGVHLASQVFLPPGRLPLPSDSPCTLLPDLSSYNQIQLCPSSAQKLQWLPRTRAMGGGGAVKLLGRTLKDLANLISHQAALP